MEENFENKVNKALNMCKHRCIQDSFDLIYPFTTENISGYLPLFDLTDKSLLTVGSSGDQVINAILLGSKNVTVFDVCPFVKEYYYLKKTGIENFSREEFLDFFCYKGRFFDNRKVFNKDLYLSLRNKLKDNDYESYLFWDKLFSEYRGLRIRFRLFKYDEYNRNIVCNINEYLKDDFNYEKIRNSINDAEVNFHSCNMFEENVKEMYDNIFLSNLCAYYSSEQMVELFYKLLPSLNDDGKMLICYLYYAYDISGRLAKLLHALGKISENISYNYFTGVDGVHFGFNSIEDTALVYKKGLNKN